ncbi:hypothetical protein I3843_15G050600 [Carya illinoinensis]|uniref:Subtilisin-like protease SBT1.9 n=2 Tax=Carya illinoinensis TaxID=32201 RepID=A0A8T1NBS2_CARIL|nr:hypothetical protein I3760_15G052900 [Carya illinoinensis]KAG6626524.1 hypothetical protein CIPAW_15G054800 [Carya illinoinensis]KAG6674641.1 hypothetical protein I3842_15G053300 [Carya illinoinensis]KAG7943615.1 hypothetical protein I3843_15G050600 [Carya illinoinensis]
MASHAIPLHVCLFFFFVSHLSCTLGASENYIIQMDVSAMPKAFSAHQNWYMSTLALATSKITTTATTTGMAINPSSYIIYSYTHALNGFSASLSPSELEALKNSSGYVSAIRDLPVKPDTTYSTNFLGLNSNSGVWPLSYYGEDVIIGVVDSGIWPESQSFNDKGMSEIPLRWKGKCAGGHQFNSSLCNKKLVGARFFSKGLVANDPNARATMSNSTRDRLGHGTHTSSTAAGNYVDDASYFGYARGTAKGVAPRARVASYKAIWEEGAYTSDIIAAIDQAIIDGVDVLSLSLGLDGVRLYEDPVAIATFAAIQKGIFVSTSAGNAGPFYWTLHNGVPWVLTVGASNMDRDFGGVVTLGNGVSVNGRTLYPLNSSFNQTPMVFMGACDRLNELQKIGNKIVVCEETKIVALHVQTDNVEKANVAAGVFITNTTALGMYLQSPSPTMFLNSTNGEIIKTYIRINSNPKANLKFQNTYLGSKQAPVASTFSSRGPSPSCPYVLKPDLMAPGDFILAAWSPTSPVTRVGKQKLYTNFTVMSGTSMSCPHATGVAALLKKVHPEWSPAAIKSAMMTTSNNIDDLHRPIKDIGRANMEATPLAMGAGQINPNKAMDPGLIYDAKPQDYVNLLCALNYTTQQIQTITKSSSNNCSSPSLDLNYPSFIAFFNANDSNPDAITTQEFQRTVTNVGEEHSTYIARLTPIRGIRASVTPNTLVFTKKNENQSFKLRLEGPRLLKEDVVFGYLSWVHTAGKRIVRSPIVVSRLTF